MPSAPASVTDADLSGIWTLSKTLSDDTEPLFILQGIGYLLRKAAKIGKVSLKIEHASAATPPTLTMTIIPPGGFKGATNVRRLDGEPEQERNFMFGQISMTYRVKKKGDVTGYHAEEEWIGENILEEIIESTGAGWINTGVSPMCYCFVPHIFDHRLDLGFG